MENNNTKKANRKDFGVALSNLHKAHTNTKVHNRVLSVYNQLVNAGVRGLDKAAKEMYDFKLQQFEEAQASGNPRAMFYNTKAPTLAGQRYHLLATAKYVAVMTYRYSTVKWEVETALKNGTPVMAFSPFKTPDMVKLSSPAQWYQLLEDEANPEVAKWVSELDSNLLNVMTTPTEWLAYENLQEMASKFTCFDHFMDRIKSEVATIHELGEWDISTTESVVYNEKASTASYVATKGENKGQRSFWSQYKYAAKKEYWYNYEVLPVDILTEYLHLTYLVNVDYKPLDRMFTFDGDNLGGKEIWRGSCIEDMVRTTPVYVDLNNPEAAEEYQQHIDTLDEAETIKALIYEELGVEFLQSVGYEEALRIVRYNLKNNQ